MRSDSKVVLYQYLTGRSDTNKGYNFRKSSDGTPVFDWMNGKTRACTIADEIPTVEIKANLRQDGSSDLVLVESRHVSTRYSLQGDQIIGEKCRPYEYSRYLVLPAGADGLPENERAEAAIKALNLMIDQYQMDVLEYQQVSENETAILEPIAQEGKVMQAEWQQMERSLGMNAKLSDLNLGVFLARFWESCWNAAIKQDAVHLIVVATSPERNAQNKGMTVIPDGMIFFNRQVLPHLPEAVLQLLCVSFGCLAVQTDAQPGTACRVCYPDQDALQSSCVYRVYHDQVRDDGVTPVHLRIGEMLLKKEMPSAYRVLSTLENSRVMQEDFEFLYSIVDFEMLLEELADKDIDEQTRENMKKDAIAGFAMLKQMLADGGFSPEEITLILYDLEYKLTQMIRQYWQQYDQNLFTQWLGDFEKLPERTGKLDENRQRKLNEAWYEVLSKPYDDVQWNENPLMTLVRNGWNDEQLPLMRDLLNNKQKYVTDLGDNQQEEFLNLLSCEQDLQINDRTEAADELLQFITIHCHDAENLLSANAYLKNLPETRQISPKGMDNLKGDLKKLLKRHCEIRSSYPLQNTSDAMAELNRRAEDWKLAQNCVLSLDQVKMTALLPEDEKLVPAWYGEGLQTFSEELYSRLLDQAVSLRARSRDLDEDSLRNLKQVYEKCLTMFYSGESSDQCPITVMIRKDWNDTAEWETVLLQKAGNNEATLCEPDKAVDRLIELRRKEQHEGADLWLKRLMDSYSDTDETLNQYLLRTSESAIEKGSIKGTVEDRMQQDVIAQIRKLSDGTGTVVIPDLELLCKWYQTRGGFRNDELRDLINERFLAEFRERDEYGQEKLTLARLYTETFNPSSVDSRIEQNMLDRFSNMTLDEICSDRDALESIQCFFKKDSILVQRFKSQLKQLIDQSEDLGIHDLPQIIRIGEMTGTSSVAEELSDVLKKTVDDIITDDVMDALTEYVRGHAGSESKLTTAMLYRCENADADNFDSRLTEMLAYMRGSEIQEDRRARLILPLTKAMLDRMNERELSKGLLNELVPAAGMAISYQEKIKANLVTFYDKAESANQYHQMEQFAKSLKVTVEDVVSRDHSHWMILLFRKKAEQFCDSLKQGDTTLKTILDRIENDSEEIQNLDRLSRGISDMEEAQETIRDSEKRLSAAFADVIRGDQSLKNTGMLPGIIRRLNAVKDRKDRFAVGQLAREAYQYISSLLKDNNRFAELVSKPTSIRELRQCIEALHSDENTDMDEELHKREKTLYDACRVFDFYDAGADKNAVEVDRLINSLSMIEWNTISGVCYEYGKNRMDGKKRDQQMIPELLFVLEKNGDDPRFRWGELMDRVFPLEQKGGWENADIWNAKENVYGKLSYMMNWLGQEGMEKESESFLNWLNRTGTAKKARVRKHVKQLDAHYDERMKNKMLSWILQKKD